MRGNTRRIFVLILTAIFLAGLAGCGDKEAAVTTESAVKLPLSRLQQKLLRTTPRLLSLR